MLAPWKKRYDQPRKRIKKQRHYFANKGLSSQGYGFSSGHEWMWELDYKESWALTNWCFWTVVLEKTHESPLACRVIQPVHPKGDQSWIFIGRTDAEAETLQYFGHLMWRTDSFEKTLMLGKIEGGRRRGQHMVRWHHWLDGHEFELAPGVGDGPEAWRVAVHVVAKSQTRLSDWTELIVVCLPDSRGENMNHTSWWKEYHPVIEYRMADTFGCPIWKI